MSYILEALKRAERERRAGTSSLLDEVPSSSAPTAAPAWQRWILPAVISALAAALATYLAVGRDHHPATAAPAAAPGNTAAPAASAAAAPAAAPATASTSTNAAAGSEPAAHPAIEDDGEISSLDDLDDQPAAANAGDAQSQTEAETETGDEAPPPRQSSMRESRHPASSASAANAADESPASAASIADRGIAPADAPAPASVAASTQNLREMPDAFRASFPTIAVDVHAYSDDPAQRFVLIGGKRYGENETLPQGPRIVGIVPEGIVFDWQGQRVLYAMNR